MQRLFKMLAVLSVIERASQAAVIGKDSPGASSLQPRNTVGTVVDMVYEHQGQPGDGTYFKFTRDLPVPAACSQAAWAPTTPYIRERFLFDWKERGVTDKKFFISISVITKGANGQSKSWDTAITSSTTTKLITQPKAVVDINNFANNAIFVYYDDDFDKGVAGEPAGADANESIRRCEDAGRPGCWAVKIPPSETIAFIGFRVWNAGQTFTPGDSAIWWIMPFGRDESVINDGRLSYCSK